MPHRFEQPTEHEAARLEAMLRAIGAMRSLEPNMPTSYMTAFLAVALKPGQSVSDYARECGTIQPIMSRILLEIGKKSRNGGPGLELVDSKPSAESLRTHEVFLTPKGKQLQRQILMAMGQAFEAHNLQGERG